MPGLATLRVACLYTHPMQTRGLARIAASCREGLLTDSVLELVDWKPDVIVVADQSQLPQLRAYAERVGAYLVGLRHGAANKYIGPDPEFSLADYVCGSEWTSRTFVRTTCGRAATFSSLATPDDDFCHCLPFPGARVDARSFFKELCPPRPGTRVARRTGPRYRL